MEKRLVTKAELQSLTVPLPDNIHLLGFRIVSVGPNTMELAKRMGAKICEIVDEQPSFFIISESPEGLRQTMHDLVDRVCNSIEGK
jgi:hypothetical protein